MCIRDRAYTDRIPFDDVKQFITQIVKQYDLFISKYDRNFLRIFILVAIVRISESHFVTMTENKLKLINTAEMKPYLNYMNTLAEDLFKITLPQDERIYLFVLLLSVATTNHEHVDKFTVPLLKMPESCIDEVTHCLKQHFALNESSLNEFKNDYNSLIMREAIYNVRDNNPTRDDYYAQMCIRDRFFVVKKGSAVYQRGVLDYSSKGALGAVSYTHLISSQKMMTMSKRGKLCVQL